MSPRSLARLLGVVGVCLLAGCGPTTPPITPAPPVVSDTVPPAAATAMDTASRLTIATFNLEFYGDEDEANNRDYGEYGTNLRRGNADLTNRLAALVAGADIIGLQEIENQRALDNFVAALNAQSPGRRYEGFIDDSVGPQDIALVWDAAAVTARHPGAIDRRFRTVARDGDWAVHFARLPITADFTRHGVDFSVLVVHLKAKSDDGTGESEFRRAAECERLLDWLDAQHRRGAPEHCLIIGDFNDVYDPDGKDTELDPLVDAAFNGRLRFLTADFAAPEQFTWSGSIHGHLLRKTIDHIIIPPVLFEHYVEGSCRALMRTDPRLSDHHPVFADFRF